jgi:hypothetical protein
MQDQVSFQEPGRRDFAMLTVFALAKFLILLVVIDGYGIFRDEYYYLACAGRLDWGYVDHPPLSIALLAAWTALFGDGIVSIRIPAAIAGSLTVFLTGLLAREMGGKRTAQAIACLAVLIAPVFLALSSFYSMNVFDQLCWVLLALIVVRCIHTGDGRYWLLFGLVAGIGLQNKISVLFLGFGIVVGLALTRYRTHFRKKAIWFGGLLAGLLVLPYVVWQVPRGFPTLEFMHNAATLKNTDSNPLQLFLGTLLEMHPANAVIWIPGLAFTLYGEAGKRYRLFGVAFLTIFFVFGFMNGKAYYLAPAMPVVLALGGVAWERWTEKCPRWRAAVLALPILLGPVLAPLSLPLLAPETFLIYQERLGIAPPPMERHAQAELPQHFADRFGWRELAVFMDQVCREHLSGERDSATIFVWNYGEAGALEYYRDEFGLPRIICPHNNYFLWGAEKAGEGPILFYGGDKAKLEQTFETVQELDARLNTRYAMPYENGRPLYLCRGLKMPVETLWPLLKQYI